MARGAEPELRTRHIGAFALLGLIWGSEWLATGAIDIPTLAALAIRYAIAALALGGIIAARRVRLPRPRTLVLSAITGITFLAFPALLTVWARERVSPGLMVVTLAMTPLIAALLEGRAVGAGLAPLVGGVGGTALLASQGLSFAAAQWAGGAAGLGAAGLIAGSVVYVRRELFAVPQLLLAAIQLAAGAVCVAVASVVIEGRPVFVWSWKSAVLEALLGIFGGALALPLCYWLLRQLESFQLTASQWVVTVVGVAESLLLAGATPSWRIASGAAILLASVWTLMRMQPDDEVRLTIE